MYLQMILLILAMLSGKFVGSATAQQIAPSALLSIDQNRGTVIERVVDQWGNQLAVSNAGITPPQLREVLAGLRADHLLAASLAGTLDGLRDVVANAMTSSAPVRPGRVTAMALGDTNADLVYTPITPCRILDTRNGSAPPYNAVLVGGSAVPVAANLSNFAPQGGSATNCNLPASFQAIAVTLTVLNPNFDAFLAAGNSSNFATLTQSVVMNFNANRGLANTAIVPVDGTVKFYLGLPAQVTTYVIADAVGYFKPPGGPALIVQGGNALGTTLTVGTNDNRPVEINANGTRAMRYEPTASSPNLVGGNVNNSVTSGVVGGTVGGGGAAGTQIVTSVGSIDCSFPAGGSCSNRVTDAYGTVGGGAGNQAGDASGTTSDKTFATVGGGLGNTASGTGTTVGGGFTNSATSFYGSVGGGSNNIVSGIVGTVGGGNVNTASGGASTVGGGQGNLSSYGYSTVSGGVSNIAGASYSTIGGGNNNITNGDYATIPGGYQNLAIGQHSVVMGYRGTTTAAAIGSFVFSDSNYNGGVLFGSGVANEFIVAASGGIKLLTVKDYVTGCKLAPGGGTWACASARELKRDFTDVDAQDILKRVATLPVQRWRYQGEAPEIRHMGTFAREFRDAFGLGSDDMTISMADADGVALAAIQALYARAKESEAQLLLTRAQIDELQRRLREIEALQAP